ncbi:MAG: patatin-like phospholipase family protein [Nannocystis sp.]|uniref:patatin-like phospholipase family protein n=1 Tax=Nannocystis sp. TaxID=1962667 RepID=UPI002425AE61|nr:patatin-like phospholipase family protein [Nannocystis sp.]MBK9755238.1 patatin-like phospholipase family protein [Nannocystis sp.]
MTTLGLVLTGGGARAAYQVGALQALAEIADFDRTPFRVLTGVSAGAINAAYLAARANDFRAGARGLWDMWHRLETRDVYLSDARNLASIGTRWIRDLGLGGLLGAGNINYLLDTAPLRQFLGDRLELARVAGHIASGQLRGVSVTATNYITGTAISFFDGAPEIRDWTRSSRLGVRTPLRIEHVLGSAAIPIFFAPVAIDGVPFGDGCVRMTAPTSPAIHLGADRIIAIGIRYFRTGEQTVLLNQNLRAERVALAEIAGVLLNAVFLDSLEADLELLERINQTMSFVRPEDHAFMPEKLRPIPALALRPSQDLGRLAGDQYANFPRMLRYLLRGIGATGASGWDLLSYLAFEPGYIDRLLELGHRDTLARKDEILAFLR